LGEQLDLTSQQRGPKRDHLQIAYHLTLASCLAGKDRATAWVI
jgi:hypothetical protein